MRCLLDKVTARHTVQGLLKLAEARDLTQEEIFALDLFSLTTPQAKNFYIVPPTASVLRKLLQLPHYAAVIQLFLNQVDVIVPARYFKRWSRRLRDYGFTGEDAAVLALATFGTNEVGNLLGTNFVATFDRPMINQWKTQQPAIQERFEAMKQDLPVPYNLAQLPQVARPEQIEL